MMQTRKTLSSKGKRQHEKEQAQKFLPVLVFGSFIALVTVMNLVFSSSGDTETTSSLLGSNRVGSSSSSYASFPPVCTAEQRSIIEQQLPPDLCNQTVRSPWRNKCSFTFATQCPEAIWLQEYYKVKKPNTPAPVAIYVGCNKGMDAVDTLRMLSGDAFIDKKPWKKQFFTAEKVVPGVCNQENTPSFDVSLVPLRSDARVYCVEAMPKTAVQLSTTALKMGYHGKLIVTNAAMSSTNGMVAFPDEAAGTENHGIELCQTHADRCAKVQMYRLDTYVDKYLPEVHKEDTTRIIDFLSTDVEGFDWEVLKGGDKTLRRVRYLEFEYNHRGKWQDTLLSTAISTLKEQGFVCYWAGANGNAWRLTDCFLDYYNLKFWSNVACVNTKLKNEDDGAVFIANRLEELFLQTLAKGDSLQFIDKLLEPQKVSTLKKRSG
jgi:FkbM family methyltransferase